MSVGYDIPQWGKVTLRTMNGCLKCCLHSRNTANFKGRAAHESGVWGNKPNFYIHPNSKRNFWCTETKFAYLHNIYIHQNICNPLYNNGLMLWVRYFMWITSILQDLEHLLLTNHIEAFTTTMIIENNWYPLFRCNVPHSCFQLWICDSEAILCARWAICLLLMYCTATLSVHICLWTWSQFYLYIHANACWSYSQFSVSGCAAPT